MHLNQLYVGVQKTQGRIDLHKNVLTFLAKNRESLSITGYMSKCNEKECGFFSFEECDVQLLHLIQL